MPHDVAIAIGSAAMLMLPILAAWSVLRAAWPSATNDVLLLGFAVPAGLGASAIVFFGSLALVGRPMPIGLDAALWLTVAFLGWWRTFRVGVCEPISETTAGAGLAARLVMGVAVGCALVGFAVQQFRDPHGGSDAVAIWNLHARVLALSPGGWRAFLGSHANGFHVDYPLLIPATVARIWSATGGTGPAPSLVAGAFLLGAICLLHGALRELKGERTAVLGTTLLVCSVYFVRTAAFQFADAPFACFLLGTLAATALAFRRDERESIAPLVLAGFLAGCASFTKNEGLLLLAVFGAVWVVRSGAGVVRSRLDARTVSTTTVALLVGLLPGVVCTLWYKWAVAPPSDLVGGQGSTFGQLTDLFRYAVIGRGAVREVIALAELGGLVLLAHVFARGGRGGWRANPVVWTGSAVVLLQLGGYFAVYLTTPYDLEWHVGASLRRLYVHVWPTWLLLFGIVFPVEPEASVADDVPEGESADEPARRAA